MNHILIVEDEPAISNLIQMNLAAAGYSLSCAFDGAKAADLLEQETFDLILLDVMLPEIDGYELMDYIRPLGIPVIFLTAKSSTEDKVKGLKAGADDYLAKPFEIAELLARVESVLRRYHKTESSISIGDLEIDLSARIVKKQGRPVNLTVKEYELLLLLIQNKNIALFRDYIYEKIWDSSYMGDSRTVDLHVQRLRKKIGWEHKIKTVYKVGYRLEDQE
ncbi:response regulator transcription factor [Anaerostipes sp.]|uniref:response regulator transcription factor n=1 Tax=Anaerostipes sp. TaxID=1872530 RepID=UPI0025BE1CEB|nr:response regulator transcription factor [Anaerostipes sp.]MBS7009407.1 response regulator transcription factor [Anaerostipes sp.]